MKFILTLMTSFLILNVNAQTLFNSAGKGIGFIDYGAIYSLNGSPIGYISRDDIYNFEGNHIGFYVNNIWYNSRGQIVYFQKGALSNVIEAEPIRGPKQPLPPKGAPESAPPRPPFKLTFEINSNNSISHQIYSSNNSNSNTSSYKGNLNLGLGSNAGIPSTNQNSNLNLINETGSNIARQNHEFMQFAHSLAIQARPYLDAAWEYYSKDDFNNAEGYAIRAIDIAGNMVHPANFLLGLISRDRKNYYQAIAYFDRAIDQYQKNGDYYAQRGLCYYYAGEKKKAKSDLKKGIRKGSENAKLYLNKFDFKSN